MLYHFELQMAGVILLSAMLACGIFLYVKRRRERIVADAEANTSGGHTWSDESDVDDASTGASDMDAGSAGKRIPE